MDTAQSTGSFSKSRFLSASDFEGRKAELVRLKKHLYNAHLSKVKWFVERFGAREVFLKPIRTAFAPLIIKSLRPDSFQYKGQTLQYFFHRYNMTWASERCVEVPIGRWWVSQKPAESTLEVGNVLSHYAPVHHQILDKFERGPGVINEDILNFRPPNRFQLIISISTFEHIGFDDEAEGSSAEKILSAIAACRRLLAPGGILVISIPINYNPELDQLIASGKVPSQSQTFLRRTAFTKWQETDRMTALQTRYKHPYPYANGIMVAEFGPLI